MSCVAQTAPTALPLLAPAAAIGASLAVRFIPRLFASMRRKAAEARLRRRAGCAEKKTADPSIEAGIAQAAA